MSTRESLEELSRPADEPHAMPRSRRAKTSFMFGLASFFVCVLAGIPAIIQGLLSLREIRQSGGRLQGKQLAVSGIILGLLGSLASGSLVLYGVARVQEASRRIGIV
jgi:hypothetical protein